MVIIDTEGDGLMGPEGLEIDRQPHLCEIGIIELDEKTLEIVDEWQSFVKPPKPVNAEFTKITGITDEHLIDAPSFARLLPELTRRFLGQETMIAHNLPYDRGVLVTELRRIGRSRMFPYPPNQICTGEQTQHLFNGKFPKQEELYRHLFNEEPNQTHRALDDARQLTRIVRELINRGIM